MIGFRLIHYIKTTLLGLIFVVLHQNKVLAVIDASTIKPADTSSATVESAIGDTVGVILFIIGIAAVIMLIVGGIRYVMSGGDNAAVASAKNTILYAIIGLIIAAASFLIVDFVLDKLTTNPNASPNSSQGSGGAGTNPGASPPSGRSSQNPPKQTHTTAQRPQDIRVTVNKLATYVS